MIDRVSEVTGNGTDAVDGNGGGNGGGAGYAQPTVYPATVEAGARTASVGGSPWRLTVVAIALTLVLGAALGGWVAMRWLAQPATRAVAAATVSAVPATARPAPAPAAIPPQAVTTAPAAVSATPEMSARIAVLEERLARISMAADSASGNAAKAEAVLVAFAARRALDRGVGLGSMEAQLRVRFGEAQPNAVDSIISASNNPVTQEELLSRLDGLRALVITSGNSGWLSRMGSSMSNLINVRRSDAPSANPAMRYQRALRAVSAGRIDQAIVEIDAMPGRSNQAVQYWLRDARRYHDARRALDLIETAALVEPAPNRAPASR
jgi:hypothetical protein